MESEVKYIGDGNWKYKSNGRCANEYMNKIADERKELRRIWDKWAGLGFSIYDLAKKWKLNNIEDNEFKILIMREIDEALTPKPEVDPILELSKEDKEFLELDIDKGLQEHKRIEHKDNVIIDDNVITCNNED